MKDENYPDNIHDFDHVPGSPFYVDPLEARDEWITARTDELIEDWNIVNEALGELDKELLEKIGKLSVEALNSNSDYRAELCGRIGGIVQEHICKYAEKLADTEFELENGS